MISSHDKYHLINTKYLKMNTKNTQKKIKLVTTISMFYDLGHFSGGGILDLGFSRTLPVPRPDFFGDTTSKQFGCEISDFISRK